MAGLSISKEHKKNTPSRSHDVLFDGAILSETRGSLVVELIKYLLYERQQIPVPFDNLNDFLLRTNKAKTHPYQQAHHPHWQHSQNQNNQGPSQAKTFLSKVTSSRYHQHQNQKTQDFISNSSQMFDQLKKAFESCPEIEQVAVLFGATVASPKESYVINFPPPCADADSLPFRSCKTTLFKQIIDKDMLRVVAPTLSPTNMMLMLSAPRQCPVQWFLPKMALSAPRRGNVVSFNFFCLYRVPVCHDLTFNGDISILSGIEVLDCSQCHQDDSSSPVMADSVVKCKRTFLPCKRSASPDDHLRDACIEGVAHHETVEVQNTDTSYCVGSQSACEESAHNGVILKTDIHGCCDKDRSDASTTVLKHQRRSVTSLAQETPCDLKSTEHRHLLLSPRVTLVGRHTDVKTSTHGSVDCIWYQSPLTIKGLKTGS